MMVTVLAKAAGAVMFAVSWRLVAARLGILLVMLVSCRVSLLAQAQNYEGSRISSIRFSPEAQPYPLPVLNRVIRLEPGTVLRLTEVSDAVQRLFETGRFIDIEVDAQKDGQNVVLEFRTTPSWFAGRVAVEGVVDPPNQAQLVSATRLQPGEEFNQDYLLQSIMNLDTVLRRNGILSAKIEPKLIHDAELQQVDIKFVIRPGKRAKLTLPVFAGESKRTPEQLLATTRWRRFGGWLGYKPATESRIQNGLERIRNYYRTKEFLMARASLEKTEFDDKNNLVKPVLRVEAGPKVKVRADGFSQSALRRLVPVFEERAVDRDLLNEGVRNIRQNLQGSGYFDADVDFDLEQQANGEQLIQYNVQRGLRYKLAHLEIDGAKFFSAATIRERLTTQPATTLRYRYGRYGKQLLDQDAQAVAELYKSNGFINAKVTTEVQRNWQGKPQTVAAFLHIEEGDQIVVGSLEVDGVNPKDLGAIRASLQSAEGQPYNPTAVLSDRDAILNYYFNAGFAGASVEYEVKPVQDQPLKIALHFQVTESRRNFVRDVVISGLKTTNRKIVEERISLRAGDVLSQTDMTESQRRLYDLGIFARVGVSLQNPEGVEREKYVLYQFEEARKISVTTGFGAQLARIGGGVTSLSSPAGSPGFSPRVSLGVNRSNFLGLGHSIGLRAQISNFQQKAAVTYLAPQFIGNEKLNLTLAGLFDDSRDVRTFASRRWESSIQLGQKLSKANTVQYRYSFRRVSVDPNTLKINSQLIPFLSQPVRIGSFSGTFIQDRRDDPVNSHRGVYNSADFAVALGPFGSETNFTRLLVRNSTYHRVAKDVILARTLLFGVMNRVLVGETTKDIPLPERFFAGGAASHRAFSDNQAGPRDSVTGFPLGGKAVLISGTELRFPLIGDSIGGVVFHDAGNVYSDISKVSLRYHQKNNTDFDYMVQSIGFGVRYTTPVGPVRVDFSYGPNAPRFVGFRGTRDELLFGGGQRIEQKINAFQFHFSLGQTF